jgi:sporulation protein YlmC with PRC-barrel domain
MRARDLIGLAVVNRRGDKLGIVTDLRCIQDGPLRGSLAMPRVDSVLVSRGHTASLLGYDRREQQGPWLVRVVVQWMHRDFRVVPWDQIELHEDRLVADVD